MKKHKHTIKQLILLRSMWGGWGSVCVSGWVCWMGSTCTNWALFVCTGPELALEDSLGKYDEKGLIINSAQARKLTAQEPKWLPPWSAMKHHAQCTAHTHRTLVSH